MDVVCSLAIVSILALAALIYAARWATVGRARHARVEKEGRSALVGKGAMEGLYWWLQPIASASARLGITADAITWLSLLIGLAAAGALATGHLGLGALLACIAAVSDALDGLVARAAGTASDAGEVLDAAVDRWVDFALVAGLGIAFRAEVLVLVLALGAAHASFMVSYSTAKAEALHVVPPRGSMRRTERTVLVVGACALAPLVERLRPGGAELTVAFALAVVAVFGNVSAALRLRAIRVELVRREASVQAERPEPHVAE